MSDNNVILLFHRTYREKLDVIRKEGLKFSDPRSPIEQLLEYYRVRHFPEKASRMQSIFFVTTLETYFKTDMAWFGKYHIVLGFKFVDEEELADFKLYTYNHFLLMTIWNKIQGIIHNWHPEVWPNAAVLTEQDLNFFLEATGSHWEDVRFVLHEFWKGVVEWDRVPSDYRAIYSKTMIPMYHLLYLIDIQMDNTKVS